jgi:UDP-glucose 4-epimerase
MSRLLITGASGFIGGYLCDWFSRQGDTVIASSRHWNNALQKALPQCKAFSWDVLSPELLDLPPADLIIHTATANDVHSRDPIKGMMLSGIGTRNVLEAANRAGIPRVIVFSTFQVYGTELLGQIDETTPTAPLNDYGLNHLVAEEYAALATRQGKVQAVSVRPSNVYGRFVAPTIDRWTLVPGCFCKEVYETGRITLRSSGLQIRNFLSLENLARACNAIIQHYPTGYDVFNIASSQNATILSIAQQVARLFEVRFGRSAQWVIESDEPKRSNSFTVNLNKLKALGFEEDLSITTESEIQALFDWLARPALV